MTFHDKVVVLERRFLDAFARGDACADIYTEDAVYLVPGMEPVRGRSAIMSVTETDLASSLKITRLTAFHTEASADLGYALETYRSSVGDGTALLTYRRDASGAWRICAEAIAPA